LGKGKTQQQAIAEIRALPKDHPLRNHVEYLLYRWQIAIKIQDELTQDDEDLIMNLSEIVEQERQSFLAKGRQEMVENLLERRFGVIDETLSSVIKRLLTLSPKASLDLILDCSREELIAKLSH